MFDPFKEIEDDYHLYYTDLHHFLFKFTQDENLIKDMIQEVFLTLLKQPNIMHHITNKKAWLLSCTKNKLIDHYRKHAPTLLENNDLLALLGPITPSPDKALLENEYIHELLDSLSADSRKLLLAKHYYGFTYEEISELTGYSVSMIKLRVYRAKKSLVGRIKQDDTK
ncbi:RNA polymerase sigma factor [Ornithinibacillus californiensis]|uniref:RNA polymerase sigma factor n=1 Tax=Ornithinibacillus californiensis TaxID=161536 RepID=UPI00064DA58F|nr:RNA polymerase sigma factor [Ornithinibacillus californiensis]